MSSSHFEFGLDCLYSFNCKDAFQMKIMKNFVYGCNFFPRCLLNTIELFADCFYKASQSKNV